MRDVLWHMRHLYKPHGHPVSWHLSCARPLLGRLLPEAVPGAALPWVSGTAAEQPRAKGANQWPERWKVWLTRR